jgi:hypothetical protein
MSGQPRTYVDLGPLDAIAEERHYQDQKWGGANHDRKLTFAEWSLILGREVGEAMDAIGRVHWPHDRDPERTYLSKLMHLRSELVQVAAVAVAIVEVIDTTDIRGPQHDYLTGTEGQGEG